MRYFKVEYVPDFLAIYDAVRQFRITKEFGDGLAQIVMTFGDYGL